MEDQRLERITEPWSLLNKAGKWYKLGLQTEAVIAADEAIEAQLKITYDAFGLPKPTSREKAARLLRKRGVELSTKRLLKLSEIREKAERAEDDDLSHSEVEEAISISEESISKITEQQESTRDAPASLASHTRTSTKRGASRFKYGGGDNEFISMSPINSLDLMERPSPHHKEVGPVETEFVTKLLLARAILDYKKKRVPHIFGLVTLVASLVPCSMLGIIGASGIILMLTGHSFFSVIGLLLDFMFLFISYIFLRIALYVKGQTR